MKDYYKILRIHKHSSQSDIRRAYRRLAIVFHPDKNPSKEASFLFQEINEAHEVLSDPMTRARYDQLLAVGATHLPVSAPPQPQYRHRDPAYRRTRPPGYRPAPAGPSERLLMMAHFLKYLRTICFIGIGWCGFLLVDYFLPPNIITEKVVNEGNRITSWKYHHVPYVVVTDQGHQFQSSAIGNEYFPVGSNAHIVTSRVLHLLIQVEADNKAYIITTVESVYGTFIFVPIILLLGSFAGLALKEGIEFRFSVQIALCMALFFNLIFLIFSIL